LGTAGARLLPVRCSCHPTTSVKMLKRADSLKNNAKISSKSAYSYEISSSPAQKPSQRYKEQSSRMHNALVHGNEKDMPCTTADLNSNGTKPPDAWDDGVR